MDGSGGDGEEAASYWSLRGRVALVTGGSAGIGLAIARALGRAGARVVLTSRRKEAVAEAVAAFDGGEAYGLACDVRDPSQVRDLVSGAVERFDRLDILVNNAGGSFGDTFNRGPLTELTGEDFLEAYRLNVVSAFLCGKEALPYLRTAHLRTGGGVIVNIGSVAGVHAGPRMAAYGAGKAALANLTRSMAEEWAPEVRVCGVTVGHIDTPRVSANRTGDRLAKVLGSIALGRLGTAEDVAAAVTYLASPAAAWNTGAMLPLHGGEKEL